VTNTLELHTGNPYQVSNKDLTDILGRFLACCQGRKHEKEPYAHVDAAQLRAVVYAIMMAFPSTTRINLDIDSFCDIGDLNFLWGAIRGFFMENDTRVSIREIARGLFITLATHFIVCY
jgi:hypothetical protein